MVDVAALADGGGESVGVVVRLRPEEEESNTIVISKDGQGLAGSCILCADTKRLTIVDPGRSDSGRPSNCSSNGRSGSQNKNDGKRAHDFAFDRVFGPAATQAEVFETFKPLVHTTVDGFTTTVFAYGTTGSGKTHTITGTDDEPGILPRAVHLLFKRLQSDAAAGSDKAFMVFLTYVEIYNNVFHNLLEGVDRARDDDSATSKNKQVAPPVTPPPPSKIEVREHPSRGVFLSGGKGLRVPVSSAAAVAALVSTGAKARATAATSLNDRSSRSHAILILEIEATQQSPETGDGSGGARHARVETSDGGGIPKASRRRRGSIVDCVSIGKMQVIDLAGSERVLLSGVEGTALVEAQNINLSLTLLGDVLSALSRYHRAVGRSAVAGTPPGAGVVGYAGGVARVAGAGPDKPFIPYRNSKLTYLLKDSLGGNCKTLMVCAVRAAPAFFQQTMMSLRYAARARDIKNVPHRVLDASGSGNGGSSGGVAGHGGPSLRGTVDEIERLRTKLVETTAEFERLRGVTASGESEKAELREQLQALADKNRVEKRRMDQLLDGVIHSQKGELERRKAEFGDLQETMDSHAQTIEKQKETIRDLQTKREAAASAALFAREQAEGLRQALCATQQSSLQLKEESSALKTERDLLAERVGQLEEVAEKQKGYTAEMDTYRKAVKKMAKEREGLKSTASEAEALAREATMDSERLKKNAAGLSLQLDEMKSRMKEEARRRDDDFAAALLRKNSEEQDIAKGRAEAERQRDKARMETETALVEAKRYREEHSQLQASMEVLKARNSYAIEREQRRVNCAQAEATAVRGQLVAAEAERSVLKDSLDLIQREKAEVELARELAETRRSEMETTLATETARRSKLQARVGELDRTGASLLAETNSLRRSLDDAVVARDADADRIKRLSTEHRQDLDKLEQETTQRVSQLEAATSTLRGELASARGEATVAQKKLEQNAAEYSEKITAAETEAEELRRKLLQLDADVRALRAARAKLQFENESKLSRIEKDFSHTEQELSRLLAEKDAALQIYLHEAKEHAERARKDVEGLERNIALQDEELARTREDWRKGREEATELLERARADAERARQDLEKLERCATEAADEADKKLREALEKKKVEAEAALEELRRRRDDEVGRLREEARVCRAEAEALRERLEQRGKEVGVLGEQLEGRKREADFLQEQLKGRQREVDVLREQLEDRRRETEKRDEEVRQIGTDLEGRRNEVDALRKQLEQQRSEAEWGGKEAEELRSLLKVRDGAIAEEAQQRAKREALEKTRQSEEKRERERERKLQEQLESQHKSEMDTVQDELGRLQQERTSEVEQLRATLDLLESEAGDIRGNLEKERIDFAEKLRKAQDFHADDTAFIREEFERQMAEAKATAEAKLQHAMELRKNEVTTAGKHLRALGRQVHQLENAKTAWEEERKEVLVSSGRGEAVVSLAEERAKTAEKMGSEAVKAREQAFKDLALTEEKALAYRQEAEGVQKSLSEELESSRARLAALSTKLEETAAAARSGETRALSLEEAMALAEASRRREADEEEGLRREANSESRVAQLEAALASLRQDLEYAVSERDEAESLSERRGAGMEQRLLDLGGELRSEKALVAALRAAEETAKLDAEDREAEVTLLRAKTTTLEDDNATLELELPQLRDRLQEKEARCRRLNISTIETIKRLEEETARASDLEREVERVKADMRKSIAMVQHHIASKDPQSPAALLLAQDPMFLSLSTRSASASASASTSAPSAPGSPKLERILP